MVSMLGQLINKDGKLICHECAQMNLFKGKYSPGI